MYFATFILFVLLASDKIICSTDYKVLSTSNHDWDILIFTQHWPITVCYQWQEKGDKNSCALPPLKEIWTVHGIWPTKFHTIGPSFCNNSWHFDAHLLSPIEQQLNIYWLNIQKNTPHYSFWKHEWMKHGTCAAELSTLDNEAKYFQKGLDWMSKYEMKSVLAKGGVLPNSSHGYKYEDIYNTVKSVLQKNPAVECVTDKQSGLVFISEIRICFSKNLTLVDCDGIKDPKLHVPGSMITNCIPNILVMYPNVVSSPKKNILYENEANIPWQLNFYRFLQFLIWFTL